MWHTDPEVNQFMRQEDNWVKFASRSATNLQVNNTLIWCYTDQIQDTWGYISVDVRILR